MEAERLTHRSYRRRSIRSSRCGLTATAVLLAGLVLCGSADAGSLKRSTYVFVVEQSTVLQTGGIGGVHQTYAIEGHFELAVDTDAGTARFEQVDAVITKAGGLLYTRDLNVLFNMTGLTGKVVRDTLIEFEGRLADGPGTSVQISLTLADGSAHLIGKTMPPCCDFFDYHMDALALKSHPDEPDDSARRGTYVFVAEDSTVLQTGGIAGIRKTYHVEGRFVLAVDADTGTAWFDRVDANLTDSSGFLHTRSLDVLFNMTGLTGKVLSDTLIEFEGYAYDNVPVPVEMTLTFSDRVAVLTGQTKPPCCDFFYFSLDAIALRKYGGGAGEPNQPYLIYTPEDMNAIGSEPNDWDKHFRLMADIDLSGYDGNQGRPRFSIIGYYDWHTSTEHPFTGVFDGNKHKISNFTYTCESAVPVGLFGRNSGTIMDLGLTSVLIDDTAHTGIGALASQSEGLITNCYAAGVVTGGSSVGALVGINKGGRIVNCRAACAVSGGEFVGGLVGENTCLCECPQVGPDSGRYHCVVRHGTIDRSFSTSVVTAGDSAGGLVGSNSGGLISNCYCSGNLTASDVAGGLVGSNSQFHGWDDDCWGEPNCACSSPGTISGCYCLTQVHGSSSVGGLAGENWDTITACYWDTEVSGLINMCGLQAADHAAGCDDSRGKTTAQMKQRATFADWDFADVWAIAEDQTYPFLQKAPAGDLNYDYRVDFLDLAVLAEHWLAALN